MKKNILHIVILLLPFIGYSQTENGHIKYRDYGNSIFDARTVLFRTDNTNLDTLTSVYDGTLAFDTVDGSPIYYDGSDWLNISGQDTSLWSIFGDSLYVTGKNVGIGTSSPQQELDVDGVALIDSIIVTLLQITGGDGTDGGVLTSQGDGLADWEHPSFGEMGFGDSTFTIALTQNTPAWVTNLENDLWSLGATNFSNGVSYSGDSLLIESAGIYKVNIQLTMTGATGSTIELQLFKNGTEDCTCASSQTLHNNETFSLSYSDITDLSDGDALRVFIENTASNDDVDVLNGKITLHRLK